MVTTPHEQKANIDLNRRARNAFNIGLLITILAALVIVGTLILQLVTGEDHYVWVTAVGIFGGIITMILARQKRPLLAVIVMITSLFLIAFFYLVTFEVTATLLTVIVMILSMGIIVQAVPTEKANRSIVVVASIGISFIILDQFWPRGSRIAPPTNAENIFLIVGTISIVLLIIFIIRQFPTFSLRNKLIGATLTVAVIAVAIVTVGVSRFTTMAITEQVGTNLDILAQSQALAIGEFLSIKLNTLETLSANNTLIQAAQEKNGAYVNSDKPADEQIAANANEWAQPANASSVQNEFINDILTGDVAEQLEKYQILFPDNLRLVVTDKYGALVGATRRTPDYYYGAEDWWQEAYVGGFGSAYIGEPYFDWEIYNYVLDIAVPIFGKTASGRGEVAGILHTTISLDALGKILLNSQFGNTGVVEIFLRSKKEYFSDQRLTVADNGDIRFEQRTLSSEAIDHIQNPENPFSVTEFDGKSHFLSSTFIDTLTREPAVDQLDWLILARQATDEILAPVEQLRRINTILGIFVVITAGVVAAYVGQLISKPITHLTKVAEEVAAGNLDIQAPIETQDEIGVLATSFNVMTNQLRDSIALLEQRVQDRTQALATTVEVGRRLSTILDEGKLLTAVVNQVRDAFDYYQAQIYLLEADGKTLRLASGTGQAGQQMLAAEHTLPMGTGLVGQAAESNQVMLVSDVTQDEDWLENPLLQENKTETAVTKSIGSNVLGVLDVQHNIINGLQQEDADLLQSVANQIAVALRNAHLYQETQQQARNEALLRSINQKINSTTDMETAMKVAVRELGDALGTTQTIVRLGHYETSTTEAASNGNNGAQEA